MFDVQIFPAGVVDPESMFSLCSSIQISGFPDIGEEVASWMRKHAWKDVSAIPGTANRKRMVPGIAPPARRSARNSAAFVNIV
jgi:hypothetical protein